MIMVYNRLVEWILILVFVGFVASFDERSVQQAIEFYNQANALVDTKTQYNAAILLYHEALNLIWEFPEAHQNLANTYDILGNYELSRKHHKHSMIFAQTKEFQMDALLNLINLETKIWPFDKSVLERGVNEAEKILKDYKGTPSALSTIALYLRRLGYIDQALKYLQRALTLQPKHVMAHLNIGNHLFYRHDFINATQYYEKALQYVTEETALHEVLAIRINLGQTLRQRGLYLRALEHFQQALALTPSSPVLRHATYLTNILAVKSLGNIWENYEESEANVLLSIARLRNESQSLRMLSSEFTVDPYTVSLIRYASPADDRFVAHMTCPISSPLISFTKTKGSLLANTSSPLEVGTSPIQKLNIGYVSYDWRQHPMGRLTASLVTPTPFVQQKHLIDVHCFMYGENDHSHMRHFVEKYCPHFHDLFLTSSFDEDAAKLIHRQNINILVDITGHTYNGRIGIACFRPAGIVINYLGYPGTTGCKSFDFTMIDRFIGSAEYVGNGEVYFESLILLPYSYQANYMPVSMIFDQNNIEENVRSMKIKEDDDTADVKILRVCVFNANKKFEPISFQTWMNLLQSAPHSELVLLDIPEDAITELLRQAAFYGVPSERLQFLPRKIWVEHLERAQSICDVALDNFVYGAHTTASDLLWMGIPILVLPGYGAGFGARMPSRVAASSLNNLWYPEGSSRSQSSAQLAQKPENVDKSSVLDVLIQDSIKGYEEVFLRISHDSKSIITRLSSIIKQQRCRCPLFNTQEHTETTSVAYHAAYEINKMLQDTEIDDQSIGKKYFKLLKSKYSYLINEFNSDEDDQTILPHLIIVPQNSPKGIDFCIAEAKLQNFFVPDNAHTSHLKVPSHIQSTNGLILDQERSFHWHGAIPFSNASEVDNGDINVPELFNMIMTKSNLWTRKMVAKIFANVHRNQCKVAIRSSVNDCRAYEDSFVEWLRVLHQDRLHPLTQLVISFLYDTAHHHYYAEVISAKDQHDFPEMNDNRERIFSQNKSIAARLKATVFAKIHFPCESAALTEFYLFPWHSLSQEEMQGFVYQLEACFLNNLFPDIRNQDIYFGSQETLYLATFPTNQVPKLHSWSLRMRWELQRFLTIVGTTQLMAKEAIKNGTIHKEDTLYAVRILFAAFYWTPSLVKSTLYSGDNNSSATEIPYTAEEQADLLTQLKLPITGQISKAEELVTVGIRPLLNLGVWTQEFLLKRGPWSFFLGFLAVQVSQTMLSHIRDLDPPFNTLSLSTLPREIFEPPLKQYFAGMQSLHPSNKNTRDKKFVLSNDKKQASAQEKEIEIDTKTIAIFCHEFGNSWWPGWGPSSFPAVYPFPSYVYNTTDFSDKKRFEQAETSWNQGKAAGGSEEAVAFLAVVLAERGYRVHIYVDTLPAKNEYGYTLLFSNTPGDEVQSDTNSIESNENNNRGGYVRWLLRRDFDRTFPYSVFIAWRIAWNLALCPPPTTKCKCYLWAHDTLSISGLPPLELGGFIIDGIFTQSLFHRDFIAKAYQQEVAKRPAFSLEYTKSVGVIRMTVLPNGLPDKAFPSIEVAIKRNPFIFIYASAPYRGLQDILEILWPEIHGQYPMAELHVFYGFTPQNVINMRWMFGRNPSALSVPPDFILSSPMKLEQNSGDEDQEEKVTLWIHYILHLLQTTPGVFYHGSVSHSIMTHAWQQASFLLYPTAFPETGCITMLRAMAGGALPVTSRYTESVLSTLGGERYDFGPRDVPLTPEVAKVPTMKRKWLQEHYLPSVFRAIEFVTSISSNDDETSVLGESTEATELRTEMQEYVFNHHRWVHSASVFEQIIQQ